MKTRACVLATMLAGATLALPAAEAPRDSLAEGFANPPVEARPLVFWQWVNGNVTQEGIRLDLEWMQRIGIAGAIMFDIGFRSPPVPQYVAERVGFGTAAWDKAVAFAASEARRLGLLLGAHVGGGWSVSGGPSVRPEQAMKKLVWSETIVSPESPATLRLPAPPASNGPYQDMPIDPAEFREPRAHANIVVIAYRLPESEQSSTPRPQLAGTTDNSLLDDESHARATELVPGADGSASITARMASPPRALTLGIARSALQGGVVEASRDGATYTRIIELGAAAAAQPAPVLTFALGERQETFWRIRFTGLDGPIKLTEARFESGARIHRFQEKAGYGVLVNAAASREFASSATQGIAKDQVLDLTSRVTTDGALSWRPAEGRWAVVRFGWSLTGRRNVPATVESLGLEVDKLDASAVRAFAAQHFARFRKAIDGHGKLDIALTDSWEAGQQNWTPGMFEEFRRRRGYDLLPWLPVLTGRIVDDAQRSERFLADFRRTLADLISDHHYGVLADVARGQGMRYFSQAAGTDIPTVVDGLQAKGRVDVPTGEYWIWPEASRPNPLHVADVREAASAAHIYGKPLVAVESLTSRGEDPWGQGPAQWRRMVDHFFAEGANRVILHTSAHQPFADRRPGMTLRQFGQHFTRNETWAADADGWVDYLSRSSWLLQQGSAVADLAVYLGDDAPLAPPLSPPQPSYRSLGLDFDYLNTEILLQMQVRDGRLVLPGGRSYQALDTVAQAREQGEAVTAKLRELERAGAVILRSPKSLPDAINRGVLSPDIIVKNWQELRWTHRALPDADVYFLCNESANPVFRWFSFRVTGRHVEVWNAEDGSRTPARYVLDTIRGQKRTSVELTLEPGDSRFVVFRGKAQGERVEPPKIKRSGHATLFDGWSMQFLDGTVLAGTSVPVGKSWTESEDPAIRYYSGRARYTNRFVVEAAWLSEARRVELNLGDVRELARVRLNGRDLGAWWSHPFRRDVTDALRVGENQLEITVTNYWANRLIGDEQPGANRTTFAPIRPYRADSSLRPSGLLGPVRLVGLIPEKTP